MVGCDMVCSNRQFIKRDIFSLEEIDFIFLNVNSVFGKIDFFITVNEPVT